MNLMFLECLHLETESIIEKINEKNLIRIFVYNKNENDETKVWESKLKCKYELLESDDMK